MKTTANQIDLQTKTVESKANKQASENSILQKYRTHTTQLKTSKEEELLQGKFEVLQKMGLQEPVQRKLETAQLEAEEEESKQLKSNNTGMPDNLKSGIENLSGYSMDDVKVHYNSSQPATLQAHAYAQGTDIHVAPGQEKHVPHEAWHVVQQKQGRVKPTKQLKGTTNINDDVGLEKEADVMGERALATVSATTTQLMFNSLPPNREPVQMVRYSVERSIKLELGKKVWEQQKEKKHATNSDKNISWQHAKTRARGQALSHLREIYPDDGTKENSEEKDLTRGQKFADAKTLLDLKYKILESDPKDQKASSTRTAIYENAPEGKRANSSQANGVKILTGDDEYIGAHLIKREWGGDDNMWNVVAWQKSAEETWAEGFERAVDMKGVFGEDPGTISISVQKEDEYLSADAYQPFVKGKSINKTGLEMIAYTRHNINRAIESVPLSASGTNFEKTTNLNGSDIGYNLATSKALEKLESSVEKAASLTSERDSTYAKIPENMEEAEKIESDKRLDERKKDWKKEKDTYNKGAGTDQFEFKNNIFTE